MPDISDAITTYIKAKDGNRPWLMPLVFTTNARLGMVVKTDAISFPSTATGVDEITEILVRRFACENENVYTFCLSSPPDGHHPHYRCDWLVGMSRRDNGHVRVGCGCYDWSFRNPEDMCADELRITIETMQTLAPDALRPVMNWLSDLPYPWCATAAAVKNMPNLDELRPVSDFLRRNV
jgi:hypothetical protein